MQRFEAIASPSWPRKPPIERNNARWSAGRGPQRFRRDVGNQSTRAQGQAGSGAGPPAPRRPARAARPAPPPRRPGPAPGAPRPAAPRSPAARAGRPPRAAAAARHFLDDRCNTWCQVQPDPPFSQSPRRQFWKIENAPEGLGVNRFAEGEPSSGSP